MLKSKKIAWLTLVALLVPTLGMFGASGAQAAASSTTLSTFTINGENALTATSVSADVSTLNNTEGVLSVDVVATQTDVVNTSVTVTGSNALVLGANTITVVVTDDSDSTIKTEYVRTLNVLNNDNTAVIVVNQEELINAESTNVDWGTTSVPVVVTPTDRNSTVKVNDVAVAVVNGVASTTVTGLTTGDNTISVWVTAPNGEADESLITVVVDQNTDTSASLTVDGIQVDDGDIVPLDAGTTDPDIEVYTADEGATYELIGGSDLIPGENSVIIFVTAEDGLTVQQYNLTLVVALQDDTSATITVNGTEYSDGDEVNLPYQTSSVTVTVTVGDPDAAYVIDGSTELLQGSNDLLVTVYAADNVTTQLYAITLVVGDPDVTLKTLKVNNTTVADNGSIITSTLQNTLLLETTDSRATFTVDGGTYVAATGIITLEPGQTDVTITVTGDDKSTTRDYIISIGVIGIEVEWEGSTEPVPAVAGSVITVPGSVDTVVVTPTAPFDGWVAEVEGDKDLDFGNNTVTISFTAPDNSVLLNTFTVFVGPADLSLATFTVGGEDVVLTGLTGRVELEPHTANPELEIEAVDTRSTFTVTGGTNLSAGNNSLIVVLTGADGRTATYTVNVFVVPSDVSDIEAIAINGQLVDTDAELTELDAGSLNIEVDTADVGATVVVTVAATADTFGGSATSSNGVFVASGYLTVSVVVTAENGVAADPVTFNILASRDFDVMTGSNPPTDTLRVGTYAKSTVGTVSALFPAGIKLSYQWLADGALLPNQNTSRLLLTAEDLERELRPVVSGMVNGVKKTFVGQKLEVSLGLIALYSTPAIQGKPDFGSTLKAIPKKWGTGVEFGYQWFVNGVAKAGATGEEFVMNSANVSAGERVSVAVTGTLEGYEDLTKTSSEVTVIAGTLRVTEKPVVTADVSGYVTGATLTVSNGSTNNSSAIVAIQWYRGATAIQGAVNSSYTATTADFGGKLTVVVTYSAANFTGTAATVRTPAIKAATLAAPAAVTIERSGTRLIAVGGYSLGAPTSSIKYSWTRNGRVVLGQSSSSYTLTAKDSGAVISVRVAATYLGYKPTDVASTQADKYQVNN